MDTNSPAHRRDARRDPLVLLGLVISAAVVVIAWLPLLGGPWILGDGLPTGNRLKWLLLTAAVLGAVVGCAAARAEELEADQPADLDPAAD